MERNPLEIRTKLVQGSETGLSVYFYDNRSSNAGALKIHFSQPPQYQIGSCQDSDNWENFTTSPPIVDGERIYVWRITLNKDNTNVIFQVHCNETEVLNFMMSSLTCRNSSWGEVWSIDKDIEQIEFISDSVSTSYRPGEYLYFNLCCNLLKQYSVLINQFLILGLRPKPILFNQLMQIT